SLNYANTAKDLANTSKADNNLIYIIIGLVVIIIVISYFYYKRKPVEKPAITIQKAEKINIDVDYITNKNPELRMDDKEVIRFIAESGGEVFANEIRDRFEIPRTSAWRMIRRLISLGIVEEKKIGGQSLIKITEKYRKEKKQ
ncbi:LPXTG cell wall anchor domain-containing protein, partial [Candidatus Bathyarchaeota archaeon]|nr:LPXTG cell wall anchor domain-containing protein [Candidatus Bathyarchaeota archaeon]